jgi:hypothetical protein
MWFYQHRHSLIILGIAAAAALVTALGGPEELIHALAGAISALVAVSLFGLYGPKQKQ